MSTNINANLLREFIVGKIGGDRLERYEAKALDIEDEEFDAADVDANTVVDIDEILDDKDLYAKFATMYVEEEEQKTEANDKEKEKEEQSKVKKDSGSASA